MPHLVTKLQQRIAATPDKASRHELAVLPQPSTAYTEVGADPVDAVLVAMALPFGIG